MRSTKVLVVCWLFAVGCSSAGPQGQDPPWVMDGGAARDLPVDALGAADGWSPNDSVAPPADRGPEVSVGVTTLRVHYPTRGRRLSVRGDGAALTWDRGAAMTPLPGDVWQWTTDALNPAMEWKPLLDDQEWSRGPNYRARRGETVEIYPRFQAVVGVVARRHPEFVSRILGNSRGVWIYLPPSYGENTTARFPVVYLHDGQNLFDPTTAFGGQAWNAQDAMNAGAEDGTVREAILVGVENTADRIAEYTPTVDPGLMQGGRAALYLRVLVEEIKPLIDREYRTLTDAANTALVGSSLGGLVSLWCGLERPEVFGLIGAMSPSTWWDRRMILGVVDALPTRPGRPSRIYVDSGDAGPSQDGVTDTRALAEGLRRAGYQDQRSLLYVVQPGATHTERYWAERLPGALRFLLGPRANTQ